jgi:hypothetical protein
MLRSWRADFIRRDYDNRDLTLMRIAFTRCQQFFDRMKQTLSLRS